MEEQTSRLEKLKQDLFIDEKKSKIAHLEERLNDEALWKDWEEGQRVSQDLSLLKSDIEDYEILELLLAEKNAEEFDRFFKKVEVKSFLNFKHSRDPAIISIHAGQGGTEAMDWVAMLYRMYSRYIEKMNWKFDLINETPGDEAGFKSVSFEVNGLYAYGFLRNEAGVHRLVRQSPFNSANLRQTSFALVEVIPSVSDDIEIEVKDEDIQFEAYRSGGAGGQNVNKVSTSVRIKHIPTGIIVECQEERRQGKNREKALQVLKSKLYALELKKIEDEKKRIKGEYVAPGWGTQIRNYVLHPYKLVKDTRTQVESVHPENILDGEIQEFIDAGIKLE